MVSIGADSAKCRARKTRIKGEPTGMLWDEFQALERRKRIQLIQELIPIGLMAVAEELEREVAEILENAEAASDRNGNAAKIKRYGSNPGTVRLGDRILPIRVPRLRSSEGEVPLGSYRMLHGHPELDSESIYRKVSKGVSTRDLEETLRPVTGAIGASKSTISRKTLLETTKRLNELGTRSLAGFELTALFIDGTSFAADQMIIALGIDENGRKIVLGFTQASTEASEPIADLLRSFLARGLVLAPRVLACIDGSKGIRKAVKVVFDDRVFVQRCQWHKRENVASYLPKSEQESFKKRIQNAYDRPTYSEAREALAELEMELQSRNQNALRSLQEGQEETLTLHRLGLFPVIGMSFKTTNCIESLNSQAKSFCRRVRHWTDSLQKQRWLASALLDLEPNLHRVRGYQHLSELRQQMMKACKKSQDDLKNKSVNN